MSGKQIGNREVAAIDVVLDFGYPATAYLEIVIFPVGVIHDINYAGSPASLFDNAPNASRLYDTTNADLYIKTLAVGSGNNGVWTKASP